MQSPQHEDIGLPFFLAIIIAVIAPTTATATQTMMIIVGVFIVSLEIALFCDLPCAVFTILRRRSR